eukprot:317066-Chlamydomonas_euryale.AAC.8
MEGGGLGTKVVLQLFLASYVFVHASFPQATNPHVWKAALLHFKHCIKMSSFDCISEVFPSGFLLFFFRLSPSCHCLRGFPCALSSYPLLPTLTSQLLPKELGGTGDWRRVEDTAALARTGGCGWVWDWCSAPR